MILKYIIKRVIPLRKFTLEFSQIIFRNISCFRVNEESFNQNMNRYAPSFLSRVKISFQLRYYSFLFMFVNVTDVDVTDSPNATPISLQFLIDSCKIV